jgi:hypothetical protein
MLTLNHLHLLARNLNLNKKILMERRPTCFKMRILIQPLSQRTKMPLKLTISFPAFQAYQVSRMASQEFQTSKVKPCFH